MRVALRLLAGLCLTTFACSSSTDGGEDDGGSTESSTTSTTEEGTGGDGDGDGDAPPNYSEPGPFPVGNRHASFSYGPEGRGVLLEYWYPAAPEAGEAANAGQSIVDFLTQPAEIDVFSPLVDAAPSPCTKTQTRSALDAPLSDHAQTYPLVLFSHCHNCLRFSTFTLAERLASHGFVVVGVGHDDNRLFDQLDDSAVELSGDFLAVRAADVSATLDILFAGANPKLPESLQGRLDPDAIGMYGHSFGAATTGLVLETDDRVVAGAAIAAPPSNPLLPGVTLANIAEPMLFFVATEDNSITEIGNNLIRSNFEELEAPAWKLELTDAGHWSFTDICQIIEDFQPGCGEGQRQTNPDESFTYLDIEVARDITADALAAFFAYQLRGETDAREQLESAHPSGAASLEMHD